MITTKEQELKALEQIKRIVNGLGEGSYIAAAFEGCFEMAEDNIGNDFACSMQQRAERAEKECRILKDLNKALNARADDLKKRLDRELEWRPYECDSNIKQADYERLAAGAASGRCCHYMTDAEAKAWICEEYDFNPDKLTIIHEVDEEEVNRHGQVRRTGKKIDRRPVYCATDYHYIRFNTTRCMYEVWNGELRPFYD